ncbi:MAG: endonuclease/exonuclease/phosphatase family protein [Bryobacteraceae bacterium]|nr:endonuclease/exonuclease/phosphatase family protein [Bryobacteraceae bacterium]
MIPRAIPLLLAVLPCLAETLSVMTFNVRFPSTGDGPDVWENRRHQLVETIREQRPDLIGTQELFHSQGEFIAAQLPEFAWFGIGRRGDRADEHMGVFYRKDRFRVLESGNFWLSETPEVPGSSSWNMSLPRLVTWGLFEFLDTSRRFYFFNTHFPHRGQEDMASRAACARVLAERLAKLPPDVPIVLTGDFNTGPASEPYRLLNAQLTDAWTAAATRLGPEGTFHGFRGVPGPQRIDWILFRGPFRSLLAQTITRAENGRYPSDHFPVWARLELK